MGKVLEKIRRVQLRWIALLCIVLTLLLAIVFFLNRPKTVTIPPEKKSETTHWKLYENASLHFSFKYPEGLLSNFNVTSNSDAYDSMVDASDNKSKALELKKTPNSYNVIFEAKAYKFEGSIKEFLKKGNLSETKDLTQQPVILKDVKGIKLTNRDEQEQKAYFEYYLFKNENYIYNFSLLTDEPILITANEALLEKIIATLKFLP